MNFVFLALSVVLAMQPVLPPFAGKDAFDPIWNNIWPWIVVGFIISLFLGFVGVAFTISRNMDKETGQHLGPVALKNGAWAIGLFLIGFTGVFLTILSRVFNIKLA